ncbi:MAG: FAD-dependent oxidoreductase [Candidatus Methanoperedens sp.]|nr:FAD-dependent oxidoreductase [Candidatus Methanoperedens sp.]
MAKIVIIGLGSGGFPASLAIRRTDPDAHITIIERRSYDMYSPCGMPFAIEGIISLDKLRFSLPEDKQTTKLLEHEAQSINPAEKSIAVKSLRTGEIITIQYDSLIIATGAQPLIPPIKGAKENLDKGVFTLHDLESAHRIMEYAGNSKRAVVVGAGPIGLEIAVALKERGLDVAVVEMLPYALPRALDKDMAKLVEQSLEDRQIKLIMKKMVSSINGPPVESVTVGEETIETDMVILAAGVKANIDLAKNAGIEIGRWGIKTNSRMETSIKGIYAVGDCIETVSLINHRPTVMQLSSAAYRQGIVAGTNAAGGYDTYEGALGTYVSLIGNLEVGATGFTGDFAESSGYMIISGKARGKNKPEYYPGSKDITVKIIADARTGRILGGQVVGEEGAGARINVISLAIKSGMGVYSLSQTEMAYCPMVAESYDVLNKAADFAVRKLEKGR